MIKTWTHSHSVTAGNLIKIGGIYYIVMEVHPTPAGDTVIHLASIITHDHIIDITMPAEHWIASYILM